MPRRGRRRVGEGRKRAEWDGNGEGWEAWAWEGVESALPAHIITNPYFPGLGLTLSAYMDHLGLASGISLAQV